MKRLAVYLFQTCLLVSVHATPVSTIITNGQKLAFMGDSITDFGASQNSGWCNLVVQGLAHYGVNVVPVFAGKGGDQSNNMLSRFPNAVVAHNPDWVLISSGINDAWRTGSAGVPVDDYATNVTTMVDLAEQAGAQVILLTATIIGEDHPTNSANQRLVGYVEWLKGFAAARNLRIIDLHSLFHDMQALNPIPGINLRYNYTNDGVHMNPRGDRLMARSLLREFGLGTEDILALHEDWLDIPEGVRVSATLREVVHNPDGSISVYSIGGITKVTPREYIYLESVNKTVLMHALPKEVAGEYLEENGGPYPSVEAMVQSSEAEQLRADIQAETNVRMAAAVDSAHTNYLAHMASVSPDANTNNIPDLWEDTFFGEDLIPDEIEKQGEMMSLYEVYVAGLNPHDDTAFAVSNLYATGQARLTFSTVTNRIYDVHVTTNLLDSSWSVVASNLAGTAIGIEVEDPDSDPDAQRFYRIEARIPEN